MSTTDNVLSVRNLKTYFQTDAGTVRAVDDVSFDIPKGKTVCLVGESGCGKSVTAMSITGLVPPSNSSVSGEILLKGEPITALSKADLRRLRGSRIAHVFQEPMSSLNPVFTLGEQLCEPLQEHMGLTRKQAKKRAIELISMVGIPRPKVIFDSYPHQLSGGMLQRIMIAMALSCDPELLIADEPTTALDVTIQAQILALLNELRETHHMSLLLITHDLGVVAEVADHVVVMYAGKVIEEGDVFEIFENPLHPYTQGLLKSKPILGQRNQRLYTIPGQVPNLIDIAPSCYFKDRCEFAMPRCSQAVPPLREQGTDNRRVACYLHES